MKRMLYGLVLSCICILLAVSVVHAAWFTYYVPGSSNEVTIHGTDNHYTGFLDVDGDTDWVGESFVYADRNNALLATGSTPVEGTRAEVRVQRPDLNYTTASAWMRSSAGAKVEVDSSGDVIVTLGTPP